MLAERIIASLCRSQFVLPWVKISGGRRLFPKLAQRSKQSSQFSLNIRRQSIRFHVEICTLAIIETIYIFVALSSALIFKDRQGRSKCTNSTKLNTQRNFLYFQYLATVTVHHRIPAACFRPGSCHIKDCQHSKRKCLGVGRALSMMCNRGSKAFSRMLQ